MYAQRTGGDGWAAAAVIWRVRLGFVKDRLQKGKSEWRKEEEGRGLYTSTTAKNAALWPIRRGNRHNGSISTPTH
jgi:hypothetical protein